MVVEGAVAEEVVVAAAVRPGEPLGRREPVGGDGRPQKREGRHGLAADDLVVCMAGDEGERVEIDAVVGGARILGDPVAGDMIEPHPPGRAARTVGRGIAQATEREQVPRLHEVDVGVAGLHDMSPDRDEGIAMERVEQVAGGGCGRVGAGEPHQARELGGELDGVGIGDGVVAESPAVVAEGGARGIPILHRPGELQGLLDRGRIPAAPGRFEGEPQHAADAVGGVAPLNDLLLRSEVADRFRSSCFAVCENVATGECQECSPQDRHDSGARGCAHGDERRCQHEWLASPEPQIGNLRLKRCADYQSAPTEWLALKPGAAGCRTGPVTGAMAAIKSSGGGWELPVKPEARADSRGW